MPEVQFVDTTENHPDPTGVQEFFSKLGKSYRDKNDRVEIGKLIDDYKTNREDANAWENLQLGLEKSNIAPTKRLETQKTLNAKTASAGKEYAKIREKSVAEYVNNSISNGDAAVDQKLAIAEARKAVQGDVAGPGWKAAAKSNPYS